MEEETIKIKKERDSYSVKIYRNGEIVEKYPMDFRELKEQLEGIEEKVFYYWENNFGSINFQLVSRDGPIQSIQFENYSRCSDDAFFRMIVHRVEQRLGKVQKVVNVKKAPSSLFQKAKKISLAVTAIGLGYYFLSLNPNVSPVSELSDVYEADFTGTSSLSHQLIEDIVESPKALENFDVVNLDRKIYANKTFDESIDSYEKARKCSAIFRDGGSSFDSELILLYDQPLIPFELNMHMYEMSVAYDIPYTTLIVAAHVESDGNFNNHGVIGCSGDYGYMQINPCNFLAISESLGYDEQQILYDDKINIECAAFILKDICTRNSYRNGFVNLDEVFQEYNGGGNFKDIPSTLVYLEEASKCLKNYYNSQNLLYVKTSTLGLRK